MRIGLVLLLLFIAGCGGSSTVYVPEVYEGQDGIVIEFVDSPPETVLEKQEFPLNLEVHNKGAHDITNGIISLIVEDDYVDILGWDGIISTTTKMSSFSLEGRSSYNIEGDKLFGTIMFQAKTLEEMTETHTVFLGVNVCYDYKTYFSDEVCIDADIYNTKNFEKTCEAKDLSSGGGQGAPVGVTHVETIMYTKSGNLQPRFKVTITNLGDGEAYVSGKTAAACSSSGLLLMS